MKKFIAILAITILVVSISSAQNIWGSGKMRAGAGGILALPVGDWGTTAGLGFGGFGKFEYGLNEDMAVQGSVGFITWGSKDNGGIKTSATAIPIIAAFKYNLDKVAKMPFYGFAELGIWSLSQKVEGGVPGFFTVAGTVTSSESVLAIGAGYDTGMLDISAKFLLKSGFSNIVVAVAYNFALGPQ